MTLPAAFLSVPLAHRGYHTDGAPENSLAAFRRAIAAGYGIELDVQVSSDGRAMSFHDDTLDRLTDEGGPVKARSAQELGRIKMSGTNEKIPTLTEVLDEVAGRVPLLIELKDQSNVNGPGHDDLERAVARDLISYGGTAAEMSFNPWMVANLKALLPDVPRGLTTCDFGEANWPGLPDSRRTSLRDMVMFNDVDASFISHDQRDLYARRVTELGASGVPILCWTVRSPEIEARARQVADNVTFEGYAAEMVQ